MNECWVYAKGKWESEDFINAIINEYGAEEGYKVEDVQYMYGRWCPSENWSDYDYTFIEYKDGNPINGCFVITFIWN
jgi:hypothetical protein